MIRKIGLIAIAFPLILGLLIGNSHFFFQGAKESEEKRRAHLPVVFVADNLSSDTVEILTSQALQIYQIIVTRINLDSQPRVEIYLFDDESIYRNKISNQLWEENRPSGIRFSYNLNRVAVLNSTPKINSPLSENDLTHILGHFLLHQKVLYTRGAVRCKPPVVPAWVYEGAASFFETFVSSSPSILDIADLDSTTTDSPLLKQVICYNSLQERGKLNAPVALRSYLLVAYLIKTSGADAINLHSALSG